MFRPLRARLPIDSAWQLLAPLLAMTLVLSAGLVAPEPVEARGTSIVSTIRAKQQQAEVAMRRADGRVEELQRLRKNHARLLKAAKKQLDRAIKQRRVADTRARKATTRLVALQLSLKRKTLVRPNPAGIQKTDKPKLRKRVRKLQKRVDNLQAELRGARSAEAEARDLKQSRVTKPTKERVTARKAGRDRAESKLSAAIYQMTALSSDRAGRFGGSSVTGFAKPAKGKLSQGFGCTGSATNPRRGSCRHFHDGVDIAAPVGTKVKAAADGYVAYAGWSPWDTGNRAYIVVIGHAKGYESIYAHLQPTRKVRAGQKVKRGQVIGYIGMTGLTTGPHVHWELKKNGTHVNPLRAGR